MHPEVIARLFWRAPDTFVSKVGGIDFLTSAFSFSTTEDKCTAIDKRSPSSFLLALILI